MSEAKSFQRGQLVTYRSQGGEGGRVEARVKRVHRDGSYTVEATFSLKANGDRVPGYLGFKFRLDALRLEVA